MKLHFISRYLGSLRNVVIPTMILLFLAFGAVSFFSTGLFYESDNVASAQARALYGDFIVTSTLSDWNRPTASAGASLALNESIHANMRLEAMMQQFEGLIAHDLRFNLDGIDELVAFLESQPEVKAVIRRCSRTDYGAVQVIVDGKDAFAYSYAVYDPDKIRDFFSAGDALVLPPRFEGKGNGVFLSHGLTKELEEAIGRKLELGEYIRLIIYSYGESLGGSSTISPYLGTYENPQGFVPVDFLPESSSENGVLFDRFAMKNLMYYQFDATEMIAPKSVDDFSFAGLKAPLAQMKRLEKSYSQVLIRLENSADREAAEAMILDAMKRFLPPAEGVERVLLDSTAFALGDNVDAYREVAAQTASFIAVFLLAISLLAIPALSLLMEKQKNPLGLFSAMGASPMYLYSYVGMENMLLLMPSSLLGACAGLAFVWKKASLELVMKRFAIHSLALSLSIILAMVLVVSFVMCLRLRTTAISSFIARRDSV